MFSRLYIEALLVDPNAADAVWEAWNVGELSDLVAAAAWWAVTESGIPFADSRLILISFHGPTRLRFSADVAGMTRHATEVGYLPVGRRFWFGVQ